jgi:hypothetical protein
VTLAFKYTPQLTFLGEMNIREVVNDLIGDDTLILRKTRDWSGKFAKPHYSTSNGRISVDEYEYNYGRGVVYYEDVLTHRVKCITDCHEDDLIAIWNSNHKDKINFLSIFFSCKCNINHKFDGNYPALIHEYFM